MGTVKFWVASFLAAAAVLGLTRGLIANEYFFFAGYVVLQYIVLATAWNILGGYTGYTNFGVGAFFAVGAYSSVVLHKLTSLPVPVMILVFGVDYRFVEAPYIGPSLHFGFVDLPLRMLIPCLVSLLMLAVLQLFLGRTFIGRAILAVSQDRLALQLMAANPSRVKRIAFGISIATASIAGALLIIIQPVEPSIGRDYIGRIFAICVLGGMSSFPGMLAGAMLIGIVESITATFYGPSWAPAVAFGFLLLTLAVRPAGAQDGP